MTRQIKVAADVLKREYVYAEPPISITALADKHGLARSGVADKARIGKWYEEREDFRRRLSDKTMDAMAEKWADMQSQVYERLMKSGVKYLDQYDAALEANEIKPSARDMIAVASMMRTLIADMAQKPADREPNLVGPEGEEFDGTEDQARDVIADVKRLMAGGVDARTDTAVEGRAGTDAAEGPAEPRQD